MSCSDKDNQYSDPLIDEIRLIRRKLSERFGNDIDKLCDYLQEQERRHPQRLVKPEGKGSTKGRR